MIAQSYISLREYHRVHGTLAMVNIWAELLCMIAGGQWQGICMMHPIIIASILGVFLCSPDGTGEIEPLLGLLVS